MPHIEHCVHRMKLIKAIHIVTALMLASSTVIGEEDPLGFVTPYEWADYTEEQKKLYVSGVIDGQIFLLYGAGSPELESFLKCVKNEGIKTIVNHADLQLGFGEEIGNPMPWAISKGIGMA